MVDDQKVYIGFNNVKLIYNTSSEPKYLDICVEFPFKTIPSGIASSILFEKACFFNLFVFYYQLTIVFYTVVVFTT